MNVRQYAKNVAINIQNNGQKLIKIGLTKDKGTANMALQIQSGKYYLRPKGSVVQYANLTHQILNDFGI